MSIVGFSELSGIMNLTLTGRAPYANEPLGLVCALAARHPSDTFVVINRVMLGKNPMPIFPPNLRLLFTPDNTRKVPDEQVNATAANFAANYVDRYVVLTGALHSIGVLGVPKIAHPDQTVQPLQVALRTQGPVVSALNSWGDALERDPVFIVNDPRSVLKCRDLKWPPRLPILAQHTTSIEVEHFRFGDERDPGACGYDPERVRWSTKVPGHWRARHDYIASRYEIFASTLTVEA